MPQLTKEFSDFWTRIDPYFRKEHVKGFGTNRFPDGDMLDHMVMRRNLAPLLYFEKDEHEEKQIFFGSVDGVLAAFKDGRASTGSVYFNSFFGSYDLSYATKLPDGGFMARAYVDTERSFSVFSQPQLYSSITADHKKMEERLEGLKIRHIDVTNVNYPVTPERLVELTCVYNEKVRAANLGLDMTDPMGLVFSAWDEVSLNARVEKALSGQGR